MMMLRQHRTCVLLWCPGCPPWDSAPSISQLRTGGDFAPAVVTGSAAEVIAEAFQREPAVVVVVGGEAADILALAPLAAWLVWDLGPYALREDLADFVQTPEFERALRRVDSVANAPERLRLLIEDHLFVGVPELTLLEALGARHERSAVILGSGLGNMLAGTPMLRWLSETLGQRITLYVSGALQQAVSLFTESEHLGFVYPDLSWTAGRHYSILISAVASAPLEPFCTADRWIRQNKAFDYNLHGRFVSEPLQNFFGLEAISENVPRSEEEIPPPFVRNVRYERPATNRIGIANGIKEGAWAKRQWPGIGALAAKLMTAGHEVVTFGLPEEHVPQTVDATGLSIRDTIVRMLECRLFVSHDGGMAHLADAIGLPTIWIFGPTGITKNGPMQPYARIIRNAGECGPCNFRRDWLACAEPVCMSSISADRVQPVVDEMLGHIGMEARPRGVDRDLVLDEMRSFDLRESAATSRSRRVELMPSLPHLHAAVGAQMIRFGDYEGAQEFLNAGLSTGKYDSSLLRDVGQALDVLVNERSDAARWAVSDASVDELFSFGLRLQESRALLECITLPLASRGLSGRAAQLLRGASERISGPLKKWALRQHLKMLLSTREGAERARQADMHELLSGDAKLSEFLKASLARLTDRDIEAILLPKPAVGGSHPATVLPEISDEIATVLARAANGPVLVVCRSFDSRIKKPGYAGAAIHRLARIFALHHSSVYLVSTDTLVPRRAPELRDNVRVINGSQAWYDDDWLRLTAAIKPSFVVDVDGAAPEIFRELAPDVWRMGVVTRGLWNANGFATSLGDELQVGLTPPRLNSTEPDRAVGLDEMIARLPPAMRPSGLSHSSQGKVLLLINSPEAIAIARYVVRRLPQVAFTVVSDMSWRGIEPNVECLLRRQKIDWAAVLDKCDVLVQVSPEPADLCTEGWSFLEQGKTCVAASPTAAAFGAIMPEDEALGEAWVEAVRTACFGRRALPLMRERETT
ncbi:glycosyltransferase family 9 protein [Reyranella sp.]|uniref:glycosyltransferase family 9 protein n=1 Tax=Reyranella sp. TaxID=1929291 RepID=UPI003BAC32BB